MPRLTKSAPASPPKESTRGLAELVKSMRASMPKVVVAKIPKTVENYKNFESLGIKSGKAIWKLNPAQPKKVTLKDVIREVPGATKKVMGGVLNQFIKPSGLSAFRKKGR